jgi:hypothetical protein
MTDFANRDDRRLDLGCKEQLGKQFRSHIGVQLYDDSGAAAVISEAVGIPPHLSLPSFRYPTLN